LGSFLECTFRGFIGVVLSTEDGNVLVMQFVDEGVLLALGELVSLYDELLRQLVVG